MKMILARLLPGIDLFCQLWHVDAKCEDNDMRQDFDSYCDEFGHNRIRLRAIRPGNVDDDFVDVVLCGQVGVLRKCVE
jgi:hypothetical protein